MACSGAWSALAGEQWCRWAQDRRETCLFSALLGFSVSACLREAAPGQGYLQVSISSDGGLIGMGRTELRVPMSCLLFLGPQNSWLTLCMFNSLLAVAATCLGADN